MLIVNKLELIAEIISPGRIMGMKNTSQKPEKNTMRVMKSSTKKIEATSKHSLISTQDEVDAILNDFGITGMVAIPSSDSDTIQNPPE